MIFKKRIFFAFCGSLAAMLFLFVSCSGAPSYKQHVFFAMDTVIEIDLPPGSDEALFLQCEELIKNKEALFSKTILSSDVSNFNTADTQTVISGETAALIADALQLSRETGGSFDITVEPLSALWNVTGENSEIPKESEITEVLNCVGYENLTLTICGEDAVLAKDKPGVRIDLGAVAKGYVCEQIVQYLKESGIPYGKLSFGGNLGLFGVKPDGTSWHIGIKNPLNPDAVAAYVSVSEGFVSVSGDYERYFEAEGKRYHHIINPESGWPADNEICSSVVVAQNGALADALSTALFVMGKDSAVEFCRSSSLTFEAMLFFKDGTLWASEELLQSLELNGSDFSLLE